MPILLRSISFLFALAIGVSAAQADLRVTFIEAAPRDQLIIANETACDIGAFTMTLDLTGSNGRLLFDTTPGGAGYNVAQPVQVAEGLGFITEAPRVTDGDEVLRLTFVRLDRRSRVVLTADLDDRLEAGPMGPTMVAGAEIAGAEIQAKLDADTPVTAKFGVDGQADLKLKDCLQLS